MQQRDRDGRAPEAIAAAVALDSMRVLEAGCGSGRLTHSPARWAREVYAAFPT